MPDARVDVLEARVNKCILPERGSFDVRKDDNPSLRNFPESLRIQGSQARCKWLEIELAFGLANNPFQFLWTRAE